MKKTADELNPYSLRSLLPFPPLQFHFSFLAFHCYQMRQMGDDTQDRNTGGPVDVPIGAVTYNFALLFLRCPQVLLDTRQLCNWRGVSWAGRQQGSYISDIWFHCYRGVGADDIKLISEGFVMWTKASDIILRPLFSTPHHPNICSSKVFYWFKSDVQLMFTLVTVRKQCLFHYLEGCQHYSS